MSKRTRLWISQFGTPFRVLSAFAVLVLSFYPFNWAASQANDPVGNHLPELEMTGPNHVEVGHPIKIMLKVKNASNLSGFETALLYDVNAAEFGGLEQRGTGLRIAGRDVSPVAAIDLPGGVAFGVYTCPVPDCVGRRGSAGTSKQARGADGQVLLANVYLLANLPGILEIKLDATKFVDADGNPVEVAIPAPVLTVQVDAKEGGSFYPAPASMWSLPATSNEPPVVDTASLDLTGDGLITHADVMEVAIEWELTRLDGAPCGPELDTTRDLNHDGCIDVADLQLAAANYTIAEVETPAPSAIASTFVVNSNGDGSDVNIGDGVCQTASGFCTLRAAIQEANAHTGADNINFNIPGGGVQTIAITRRLPSIYDASGPTTINGYTQPGASPNTDPLISNAVIRIQLQGGGENYYDGFVITSDDNVIRGLAIYKFRRAFWIRGSGAMNNLITGSFIGTNAAGTYGAPALANTAHGFHIEQGASGNQIGGPTPAERNVISGNGRHGLGIWHEYSDSNVIQNNLVGLNPAGNARLPNRMHGLDLNFGSSSNLIEGNVSSGNDDTGIEVSHLSSTRNNSITNNLIGTDVTGNNAPAYSHNGGRGIMIEDGASDNTFTENVIGNNYMGGIEIRHTYTSGNQFVNNRIGIGLNGNTAGNLRFGILVNGSQTMIGPDNIIAYNQYAGLKMELNDADYNTITRNEFYNNGGLGIDIFPAGVNPNDQGDNDSGPNNQLNFPILTSATPSVVNGTACGGCTVEIFVADSNATKYGEGKRFVGSGVANGNGVFAINVNNVAVGDVLTSTATDNAGNTSEFSHNIQVLSG